MATRSTIALEFADGTVQQVYCHWDGYLDYNGAILEKHWSDPFKLQTMIDLGDMSCLGKDIGSEHDFDQRNAYDEDNIATQCTFYARDRSETGCVARKYKNSDEYFDCSQQEEYDYILRNVNGTATWFVRFYSTNGVWVTLAEALALDKACREDYA